jgi:hypothetical protein
MYARSHRFIYRCIYILLGNVQECRIDSDRFCSPMTVYQNKASLPSLAHARRAHPPHLCAQTSSLQHHRSPTGLEQFLAMASSRLIDRTEPVVIPRAHATPTMRSRLSSPLRVLILIVLNSGLKSALWSFALNFLNPELGAISKVPDEADLFSLSLYSPIARVIMNIGTICMNWYFNYDCKNRVKPVTWTVANFSQSMTSPRSRCLPTRHTRTSSRRTTRSRP